MSVVLMIIQIQVLELIQTHVQKDQILIQIQIRILEQEQELEQELEQEQEPVLVHHLVN